jgi:high-affinity nickel-transport protein
MAVADPSTGLQVGLALTAIGLGFRHGIDWDHIAALTDITGSQDSGRRSMVLATMYALGHALVVFVLGVVAIALSAQIPHWLDDAMSRVVGVTLVVLGTYLLVSLVRHGRDFRMRSRWMLVFAGARRIARWVGSRRHPTTGLFVVTHEHDHPHDELHDHAHTHAHDSIGVGANVVVPATTTTQHRHMHHHIGALPEDPFPTYGRPTAFAVGALHGVGAETPTQILLFLAAARAGGTAIGVALLLCFIVGLVASNSVVALATLFGFRGASRNFPIYATISVVAAVFSLVVGTLFLVGEAPLLPALSG